MAESNRLTPQEVEIGRRSFLARAAWGAAFASMAGFLLAGARYVFPNVLYESPSRLPLGPPERFPQGASTELPEERLIVFHDADGLAALSTVCTHLGCSVRRAAQGFECPCHGSRFNASGKVTHGPASKPLAWRRLSLSPRGLVIVDQTSDVDQTFRLRV